MYVKTPEASRRWGIGRKNSLPQARDIPLPCRGLRSVVSFLSGVWAEARPKTIVVHSITIIERLSIVTDLTGFQSNFSCWVLECRYSIIKYHCCHVNDGPIGYPVREVCFDTLKLKLVKTNLYGAIKSEDYWRLVTQSEFYCIWSRNQIESTVTLWLRSELKKIIVESRWGPVPHSWWRRQWYRYTRSSAAAEEPLDALSVELCRAVTLTTPLLGALC